MSNSLQLTTLITDVFPVLTQLNANCIPAISMLREREPGAFVIRDSHSFRGAYGLAMKVASPPPSVHQSKKGKRGGGAMLISLTSFMLPYDSFILQVTLTMSW